MSKTPSTIEEWAALEKGTEIVVSGARGRFTFHSVGTDGSLWVFGGTRGRSSMRAFDPGRCRPIYRRKKAEVR